MVSSVSAWRGDWPAPGRARAAGMRQGVSAVTLCAGRRFDAKVRCAAALRERRARRRHASSMKLSVRLFVLVLIAALPIFAMQVHGLLAGPRPAQGGDRRAGAEPRPPRRGAAGPVHRRRALPAGGGGAAAGRAQARAAGLQRAARRDPAAVPDDLRARRGRSPTASSSAGRGRTGRSTSAIATISSARCERRRWRSAASSSAAAAASRSSASPIPRSTTAGEVAAVVVLGYRPRGAVAVAVGHALARGRHDQPGRRQRRAARPRAAGARVDRPARARGRLHPHHADPPRGRDGGPRHRQRRAPARLRAAARLGRSVRGRRACRGRRRSPRPTGSSGGARPSPRWPSSPRRCSR